MPQPCFYAKEAEVEQFYENLPDLLELTPKKDVLFIVGYWKAKVGNQELPGVTGKFGLGVQNEAGQRITVLPRKRPLPTTQEMTLHMDITRWSIPKSDWLFLSIRRWRSSIQSTKTRPGSDCGLDHELLISKFRLQLKKVGKNHLTT